MPQCGGKLTGGPAVVVTYSANLTTWSPDLAQAFTAFLLLLIRAGAIKFYRSPACGLAWPSQIRYVHSDDGPLLKISRTSLDSMLEQWERRLAKNDGPSRRSYIKLRSFCYLLILSDHFEENTLVRADGR